MISEIKLYSDVLIIESITKDLFIKNATEGFLGSLIGNTKDYFKAHIDPKKPNNDILNLLAPGAIYTLLRFVGLGFVPSTLAGLLLSVFHVDVTKILESIYEEIKQIVESNKKVKSSDIQAIVSNKVDEHFPTTEIQAQSFEKDLLDVKFLKLSLVEYDKYLKIASAKDPTAIEKAMQSMKSLLGLDGNQNSSYLKGRAQKTFLKKVLGWVFTVGLASAGFVIAGDAINALLGRPSALTHTIQDGKPVAQPTQTTKPEQSAEKEKNQPKSSYTDVQKNTSSSNWIESIPNNKSSIENLVIQFAKDVYPNLESADSKIKSSPIFNKIVREIQFFNHSSPDSPMVFIPKIFTSKKNLVDYFINDIK